MFLQLITTMLLLTVPATPLYHFMRSSCYCLRWKCICPLQHFGGSFQDNKPIAFYSRKLNDAQTRYTTTERELLSIVETLKEYRNILLGHEITVYTDHKNLVYKHFNTERVMCWRLLLEEFGPKLLYFKGGDNIVADALSRMRMTEEDFSAEAFAIVDDEFPEDYPLSYKELAHEQGRYPALQQKLTDKDHRYTIEEHIQILHIESSAQ